MTKDAKKETKAKAKVIKVTVLNGAEAISTAIASIAKRGKALDKDIHAAAVSTLIHADKHGDITLANKLIEALPASQRKNALRDWFCTFGKFSYNTETKALAFNREAVTMTDKATQTPFWVLKPEAEYVPLNVVKELERLIARAGKAEERGDIIPADFTEKLAGMVKQYSTKDVLAA